jgi:Zn-dependent peptidase ImmA (M78 family)
MYAWIDDIICGLSEIYNTNNVYELYDILNIQIKKLEPSNILLYGNDSIYIRDDLSIESEKFILLHELWHALLHVDIFSAAFNRKFINKDQLEKQANYFAFKMLNIEFDAIELEGMTSEQISSCIEVPYKTLCQIINS